MSEDLQSKGCIGIAALLNADASAIEEEIGIRQLASPESRRRWRSGFCGCSF